LKTPLEVQETRMFHLKRTTCRLLVLGSLVFLVVQAEATTYYVATTGNDATSCASAQSANTPRATVPGGVACLGSGDTLIIKAGTYRITGAGVGMIQNPPAGSASAYPTIKRSTRGW